MYIDSRAGLGESNEEPIITNAGDVVGPWRCQGMVPGGIIRPDEGARVIGLKVIFRRSFANFRREVQRAVERVVTDPRVASKFMTANENLLKGHHKQMLDEKVPDNALVRLVGSFSYKATGCTWSVVKLTFPPERARWERIPPNMPASQLLRLIRPFPWR
jgi:hypothetical protein